MPEMFFKPKGQKFLNTNFKGVSKANSSSDNTIFTILTDELYAWFYLM
jgi:hypothetical protein